MVAQTFAKKELTVWPWVFGLIIVVGFVFSLVELSLNTFKSSGPALKFEPKNAIHLIALLERLKKDLDSDDNKKLLQRLSELVFDVSGAKRP